MLRRIRLAHDRHAIDISPSIESMLEVPDIQAFSRVAQLRRYHLGRPCVDASLSCVEGRRGANTSRPPRGLEPRPKLSAWSSVPKFVPREPPSLPSQEECLAC